MIDKEAQLLKRAETLRLRLIEVQAHLRAGQAKEAERIATDALREDG
jgi:hypothetical protein